MFQFPRLPSAEADIPICIEMGFPIRVSPAELARQLTEAYRRLATPFIGLWYQGIPHTPLVA